MKYFSGFCLKNEQELFEEYIEEGPCCVAGFSFGAQKALEYAVYSKNRIDKLQLFSPAFFDYNSKIIDINIKAFRKNKKKYMENFFKKAGYFNEIFINDCNEKELLKLFTFNWEIIKELNNIKIEVFFGEYDKIIALKKAQKFFTDYADVYLIKKANHFLRS